jgi:hypothetical protein
MLTNVLWAKASPEEKREGREAMKNVLTTRFEKFYLPEQGAFRYYSDAREPDLDGTGEALKLLDNVGALSQDRRIRLWGISANSPVDLGVCMTKRIDMKDLRMVTKMKEVNSIRFYRRNGLKSDWTEPLCVVYPRKPIVLDATDLLPRLKRWADGTPQKMGNWVSKEWILRRLAEAKQGIVPVVPMEGIADFWGVGQATEEEVVAVGFDPLQVPLCKILLRTKKPLKRVN